MSDVVNKITRSRMMAGIKGKDTQPELIIRKRLHALGFRYNLHDTKLPGKPDLVFPKYKAVIFVNGCFWHGHNCYLFKWPSSNDDFWQKKITRTIEKDKENISQLENSGWRILQIWECAIKGRERRSISEVILLTSNWLKSGSVFSEISGKKP
jgi:DNA mismatch endonuclease (patch repair protein)